MNVKEVAYTDDLFLTVTLLCVFITNKLLTMRTIFVIVELEPVEEASILKGPS